jgi:excinuclease ABC subunit C
VISLAKRFEEVYIPGRSTPLPIPEGSSAMRVLQAIRNEAHRFAVKNHRGKRGRAMTGSVLDALPGIGQARRSAILKHFGSPERFLEASPEEIAAVPGLPRKIAQDVYDHLHKTVSPEGVGLLAEEAPASN